RSHRLQFDIIALMAQGFVCGDASQTKVTFVALGVVGRLTNTCSPTGIYIHDLHPPTSFRESERIFKVVDRERSFFSRFSHIRSLKPRTYRHNRRASSL